MSAQHATMAHVGRPWRVVLRDLELDEQAILRRAAQPRNLFDGTGTWISVGDYYSLFDAVEAEAGDPAIATRAGEALSTELFHPAYFAAMCSPDLSSALSRLSDYMRLVGPFALDVSLEPDVTVARYRCKNRPDVARGAGLSQLAFIVALARRATRHHITPRRVGVAVPADDLSGCAAFFGVAPVTSSAWEVTFTAGDATRPFLTHDEAMWRTYAPSLRRHMSKASAERPIVAEIDEALLRLLPSGRSSMADVCSELGLGERTLQRRLAAAGTSWGKVLSDTRERLAVHYVTSTELSAREIGFLLGFQEPNSLYRSFQRWTGTTPESYRASRRDVIG